MDNNYWKDYYAITAERDNAHKQVERTYDKKPIDKGRFNLLLKFISKNINLKSNDTLLDLCCGNGLITSYLAKSCKMAIGVDFTEKLINDINKREGHDNIIGIVDDITKVKFKANSFDKIIMYFSIQHLSQEQAVKVFRSAHGWLKKGGIFYLGDIPDRERMWTFFNTIEREQFYFSGLENDTPILGNWHSKDFLIKLGKYANFKECKIIDQPKELIYSHYRFDMILKK